MTTFIVGAGYVGLPLATKICQRMGKTYIYDTNEDKIAKLRSGESYVEDVSSEELRRCNIHHRLTPTTDPSDAADADVVIFCVPTPLRKTRDPDVSYVVKAAETILPYLHPSKGDKSRTPLILLESTVYPGFTREVFLPLVDEYVRMQVGSHVFLAFSPERVDPGNTQYGITNTPKVVGGVTKECTEAAATFYRTFIEEVHTVSSCDAAEMIKLHENTFRAVNIGLANELYLICEKLDIDPWEVIRAAATKPFGFMPFYPGPGLGGHCIPIDPLYLSWRMKSKHFHTRFIELADEINMAMPQVVVRKVIDALNSEGKAVSKSIVAIYGVAYKANTSDTRESPALDVIEKLLVLGADVMYHDPFVEQITLPRRRILLSSPPSEMGIADCSIILTNHPGMEELYEGAVKPIVDMRGALS